MNPATVLVIVLGIAINTSDGAFKVRYQKARDASGDRKGNGDVYNFLGLLAASLEDGGK